MWGLVGRIFVPACLVSLPISRMSFLWKQNSVVSCNTNTGSSRTVTFHASPALTGTLRTWSYSAKGQNSTNSSIVTGTTSAAAIAHGITLPAESMTVVETQ